MTSCIGWAESSSRKALFPKAQFCFQELVDRGVEKPEVYVHLARSIYYNRFETDKLDKLMEVAWAFKKALGLDSTFAHAHVYFGEILEKEGKIDFAKETVPPRFGHRPREPQSPHRHQTPEPITAFSPIVLASTEK